jgi:hypothetical protein
MALPVLTKAIFDNISDVRSEGRTGLRPASYTVALAMGMLAMMIFGEFCNVHTRRISNTMGYILRGAVSDLAFGWVLELKSRSLT